MTFAAERSPAEVPQLLPDSIAEEPEAHLVGVTYLTKGTKNIHRERREGYAKIYIICIYILYI